MTAPLDVQLDATKRSAEAALTPGTVRSLWGEMGARFPDGADRAGGGWIDVYGPPFLGEGGKTPSFGVHLGHGGYRDMGGAGARGDVWRAVGGYLDVDLRDAAGLRGAVVWMADRVGVAVPDDLRRAAGASPPPPRHQAQATTPPASAPSRAGGEPRPMRRPLSAARHAELRRVLEADTPAAAACRAFLLDQKGIGPGERERYGLGLGWGDLGGRRLPWVVVPFRWGGAGDGEPAVTHAQRFAFDPEAGRWAPDVDGDGRPTKDKAVRCLGGICLFPDPAQLAPPVASARPGVVLCEGPWDAVAARAAGLDAYGVAGAGNVTAWHLGQLAARPGAAAGLTVAFDADDAGRQAAEGVVRAVLSDDALHAAFGRRVAVFDPAPEAEDGTDLGDLARRHGPPHLVCVHDDAAERPPPDEPVVSDPGDDLEASVAPQIRSRHYRGEDGENEFDPFTTALEWSRNPPPPTEWVVPGLFPAGATVLLSGPPKGAGKTTFVTAAVAAVLRGDLFLGERTMQSPVVYLTEQPQGQFQPEYLVPAGCDAAPDLHVAEAWRMASRTWAEVVAAAGRRAEAVGARLVVVDTFARFAKLGPDAENDAGAVTAAIEPLQGLAGRLGVCVVVIHHDRKGGGAIYDAGRGSSALAGNVDVLMSLRPDAGKGTAVRKLEAEGRYADLTRELYVERGVDGTYRPLGTAANVAGQTARDFLFHVLPTEADGALTFDSKGHDDTVRSRVADAAEALALDAPAKRTLERMLKNAVSTGQVVRLGEGKKGDAHRHYRPGPLPPDVAPLDTPPIRSRQAPIPSGENESETDPWERGPAL